MQNPEALASRDASQLQSRPKSGKFCEICSEKSNIASDIKRLSIEYCQNHNVIIHYMETDKDHIHYMIETTPNINLSNMVKTMKSYITYHIWEKYSAYLSRCFWKERTFFSDGYFISSIGNVSQETLKNYIENQGK